MCGINGFIQFRQRRDKSTLYNIVHEMNDRIIHRGPDKEGIYADNSCALGMRRLSIIDLNNGYQPIWNENYTAMVVFNGEIYNFKELRAELISKGHIFRTDSDTEVIVHGYEQEGTDFFCKIEGMFAFCIYDLNSPKWIISRDRVGEKPLYYFLTEESCIFGSELKSLLSTGLIKREIDRDSLNAYFQLTYIPAPKSIIKKVYKLLPGTYMEIYANGKNETKKFWDISEIIGRFYDNNFESCKRKLRDAFFSSVEHRMVSDVPLGAFLSGGFDSSIVVGIMSHISASPINTFTIGFNEKAHDESSLAAIVAKRNGTNHHLLTLDWSQVEEDSDDLLNNIDEPFADPSLIATYEVSKLTRKYITVVLTGDAGDELFAGYNKYLINYYGTRYRRIPLIFRKGIIEPIFQFIPKESELSRKVNKTVQSSTLDEEKVIERLLSLGFREEEAKGILLNYSEESISFVKDEFRKCRDLNPQTRMQYIDFKILLEGDMLAKVDRASMLASIETRVPMLDSKVIEIAYNMPTEFKINNKNRKIILKDTFKDLLPEDLFHAPKHGFTVPIDRWLGSIFYNRLLRYASRAFIEEQGLFNYEYVHSLIENHMNHVNYKANELWTFFVFQNWYSRVIIDQAY